MRLVIVALVLAACGVEEPPCGAREERPVLEGDDWCIEDYTITRLCCAGDGACGVQVEYDDDGVSLYLDEEHAPPAELPCGTADECFDWIVGVEAWCRWDVEDNGTRDDPPEFPERRG